MPNLAYRQLDQGERRYLVSWWLATGERLTCELVAARLSIDRATAYRILRDAERVLPIVRSDTVPTQWHRH